MSDYIFKIENKNFTVYKNYLNTSIFNIKSSPKNYKVFIKNSDPKEEILKILNEKKNNILFIDKNVYNLYFNNTNIDTNKLYIFDAIEENKIIENALKLIKFLEERGFTKSETMIVCGGGIVQDIGAFVGATFKRGINWVFYPTTLLSQCDSCIGGKTGLNYNGVKNQIALFSAPTEVIINIKFLTTLNDYDIRSGLGEIAKLCITGGEYFFDLYKQLVRNGKVDSLEGYKKLILSALFVKKAVIEYDEFEFNIRKSLNYGHTLGHSIEVMSNYKIPHGQAVAMGSIIANKLSHIYGYLSKEKLDYINSYLFDIINKKDLQELKIDKTLELIKKDKKVQGNTLSLVGIKDLGDTIFIKINIDTELFNHINIILEEDFSI
ncbi:3-dehydroquinate synthase family protein [Brachyspira pilosicoli]|uniref:3-dehydroquinate synthase n=1 Tax=Brachyspira pilosicoli TaxID=52584 RepID=UPI0030059E23